MIFRHVREIIQEREDTAKKAIIESLKREEADSEGRLSDIGDAME